MTEYIFTKNKNNQELHRLKLIEKACDPTTKKILQSTGIKKGDHCLEIGAGAGSVLKWMGEQVGPEGLVIGVDKNIAHIKELKQKPFQIIEGSIQEIKFSQQFNLIHLRYMLIHNKNSTKIIYALSKLLKADGTLILEEPDFTTASWLDTYYQPFGDRVNSAICAMFQKMGLNPGYGSQLALDLAETNLLLVGMHLETHENKGGGPFAKIMAASAEALKEKYIETGETDLQDIKSYIKGAKDPNSQAIYYSTVSLVAKKAS